MHRIRIKDSLLELCRTQQELRARSRQGRLFSTERRVAASTAAGFVAVSLLFPLLLSFWMSMWVGFRVLRAEGGLALAFVH